MVKFVYNQMYHTLTKMLGNKRGSSISVSPRELDQMILDFTNKLNIIKQHIEYFRVHGMDFEKE